MEDDQKERPTKTIITLVHGTFAKNAKWILSTSSLSRTLRDNLDGQVVTEPFTWSGFNAQISREHAAEQLRDHIRRTENCAKADGFEPQQFIIAHSHGGNVALMALKDVADQQRVSGVACLATPFLYFRSSLSASSLGAMGLFLPVVILLALAVAVVEPFVSPILVSVPKEVMHFVGAVLLAAVVGAIALKTGRPRSPFASVERLTIPHIPRNRLLLLRTIGDEASGLIAGMGLMSWVTVSLHALPTRLSEFVVNFLFRTGKGLVVLALLIAVASTFYYLALQHPALAELGHQAYLYLALITLGLFLALPTAMLILRTIAMLAAGWDVPFRFFSLMVTAEVTPNSGTYDLHMLRARDDAVRSMDEYADAHRRGDYRPSATYEALKHSEVYEHPQALDLLVRWIRLIRDADDPDARGASSVASHASKED